MQLQLLVCSVSVCTTRTFCTQIADTVMNSNKVYDSRLHSVHCDVLHGHMTDRLTEQQYSYLLFPHLFLCHLCKSAVWAAWLPVFTPCSGLIKFMWCIYSVIFPESISWWKFETPVAGCVHRSRQRTFVPDRLCPGCDMFGLDSQENLGRNWFLFIQEIQIQIHRSSC